ncbi:response regulator, partial [bacterium]|nr:response regulator [bacterium]
LEIFPILLQQPHYIKITVKDNGTGIPEKHHEKIFDPYFTTKEKGNIKGTGLGLATCYSIITRHKGLITLESKLNEGTTFYIYLPASNKKAKIIKETPEKIYHGNGRILVIDDDNKVLNTIDAILKRLGYKVDAAKNGKEAIAKYIKSIEDNKIYDCVIIDLTIPGGMCGKETIKELLQIDPDVKAIAASGYSNDPVLANYQNFGFSSMMTKPLKINELSSTIHCLINNSK